MKLILDGKVYEVLKWIALIGLPAAGALYSALAGSWGWPYTEQILATLAALETFIGALIGISTAAYRKEQKNAEQS